MLGYRWVTPVARRVSDAGELGFEPTPSTGTLTAVPTQYSGAPTARLPVTAALTAVLPVIQQFYWTPTGTMGISAPVRFFSGFYRNP